MKRTFDEFQKGQPAQEEEKKQEESLPTYGESGKRKRMEEQRIGDFIVKGLNAIHFKLVSTAADIEDES